MTSNNGKEKHLHTYRRIKERPDYYACIHPDCTHYINKMFLHNKRARCYYCGEPFIISSDILRYSKLRCSECRQNKPKEVKKQAELAAILKGLEKI